MAARERIGTLEAENTRLRDKEIRLREENTCLREENIRLREDNASRQRQLAAGGANGSGP